MEAPTDMKALISKLVHDQKITTINVLYLEYEALTDEDCHELTNLVWESLSKLLMSHNSLVLFKSISHCNFP